MKNEDYKPRPGDILTAKLRVLAVSVDRGDKPKTSVSYKLLDDNGGPALTFTGDGSSYRDVETYELSPGDRVRWHSDRQWNYGEVLYIEPAESAAGSIHALTPGRARALIRPDGLLTRPMVEGGELQRVD